MEIENTTLTIPAPEPSIIPLGSKIKTSNIEDDCSLLLTPEEKTDLTDGNGTTLHKHTHADIISPEAGDDHTQYIPKNASRRFTGTGIGFLDEDDMATNDNRAIASQQSIKAYVDNNTNFNVGDLLYISADTERNTSNTSYTIVKQITIKKGGTLRIKFDIKRVEAPSSGTAYGLVYKNGSPVGTVQTTTEITYQNKSQDIAGWSPGDSVRLYIKADAGGGGETYIQNFRIYVDKYEGYVVDTD